MNLGTPPATDHGVGPKDHVVALDGVVLREEDGAVVFHPGPSPTREQIASVAGRVHQRMAKWLRRRKLIDYRPQEDRSNEAPELTPIEACMQLSLSLSPGATFVHLEDGSRSMSVAPTKAFAPTKGTAIVRPKRK